ncbi:MAG: hypothetical protein J3Q66DRAFT_440810 [Benniella sp.]|nr:MAG: hypothetical protein J3Q66DRAFT_440810 [Benniella sp.]
MRIVENRSTLLAIIAALAPWAHLYVHAEGGWSDSTEEWTFPDPTPTSLSLTSPEPTTTSSYPPVSSTPPPGIRTLRGPPGFLPSSPTPPAATPPVAPVIAPALPTAPFSPQPPPLYAAPPHPLLAWVDYYDSSRTFLGEATTGSGDCHTIPIPDWGILHITPTTSSESVNQLILYNDPDCSSGSMNREAASRTPPTIVRAYFKNVPQSLKWIRPLPSSPPNAKLPGTPLSSSTTPLQSATSVTATTTPTITSTSTQQPTPIRTTFPTSLIPPKPRGSGGNKGNRCRNDDDDDDDGRCGSSPVNKVLIVGITIAVLVVGLMMAGTFYIYKTFYAPPESSIYESFTVGSKYNLNSSSGDSNSNSNINNPTGNRGTLDAEASVGLDQSHRYVHEEDENSAPRFMFDHSHDNINTNRDPKKFKESSAPSPSSSSQRDWLW